MSDLNFSADQLNIETPEQVDLRFPIAGMGSRMIAIFLDQIIQFLAYVLLFVLAYVTLGGSHQFDNVPEPSKTAQNWLVAGFVLLNFVFLDGYYVLFEAFWNGQTPGKRVMKLRVLKDSGRSITLFESLTRNLLRAIDYFPAAYLVGLISMLCNKQNKRLGDFAAGTIVIHERSEEQPFLAHNSRTFTAPVFTSPQQENLGLMPKAREAWAAREAHVPADAIARLSPSDLHLVETFFSRALDLSIDKRAELGARLAGTICAKMRFPLPPGMGAEQLLELVAFKMRAQGR